MDITIPPHNLKRFTAAITCLGKIGKDLYLSFDPLDGLELSSLNEAKSAFGKFHFDSTFFERCSAPAACVPLSGRNGGGSGGHNNLSQEDEDDDEFYDSSRYVCRVPVRSVHSVLRPRKGVSSLRIRSEGTDDSGNHFGLNNKRRRMRHRRRQQQQRSDIGDRGGRNDGGDNDDNDDEAYSSSARRRQKRRSGQKDNSDNADCDKNTSSSEKGNDKMMLSFEFFIERPASAPNHNRNTNHNNVMEGGGGGGTFRVLHKVGVTDANGITLSASTRKRDRSEIVSPPKLWLRLLDPLRRTAEVALTIDDELKVVTATSFHPAEMHGGSTTNTEDNAVLQAAAAKAAVLKTETSTGTEEFDEYDFRSNRGRKKRQRRKQGGGGDDDDTDDDNDDNEDEEGRESDRPPPDVNQKVILVFSIKEAKAMLQFCAQTNSTFHDDGDALSILSFHWGGKPIVIETDGDSFSGELVLATLHHRMITSNITVGGGRRESSG
ncbi:hypothetical protein ACHAXM_009957 [Skeletonema potamos]|jgi:hypothetical protein